jgi:hypothetical protein
VSVETILNGETWKPVVGYEGSYEVSDMGRVRSLDRTLEFIRRGVPAKRFQHGKILCTPKSKDGYPVVTLAYGYVESVHTLVLTAFVGPKPNGHRIQCLHGDGSRDNNYVGNLRWGTPLENSDDMETHGTRGRGSSAPRAILTEDDVIAIRKSASPRRLLATKYGVHLVTIHAVQKRRNWRHLP